MKKYYRLHRVVIDSGEESLSEQVCPLGLDHIPDFQLRVSLLIDGHDIECIGYSASDGAPQKPCQDVILCLLGFEFTLPGIERLEVLHKVLINSELNTHKHAIGR
jgi:hypothetical protein